MKLASINKLRARFPFISKDCKFNFGDGWLGIISAFFEATRLRDDPDILITQVEIRDGKLSIEYTGHGGSQFDQLIARVEFRSLHTCERCARYHLPNGDLHSKIYVIRDRGTRLCPECYALFLELLDRGKELYF